MSFTFALRISAKERGNATPTSSCQWHTEMDRIPSADRLGGPVRIPELFNGKDRHFLFLRLESDRQRSENSISSTTFQPQR